MDAVIRSVMCNFRGWGSPTDGGPSLQCQDNTVGREHCLCILKPSRDKNSEKCRDLHKW